MLYHQPSKTVCREPNFWNILKRVSGSTMTGICQLKTLVSFFSCFFPLSTFLFMNICRQQLKRNSNFVLTHTNQYVKLSPELKHQAATGILTVSQLLSSNDGEEVYYIIYLYFFSQYGRTKSSLFFTLLINSLTLFQQ